MKIVEFFDKYFYAILSAMAFLMAVSLWLSA